MKAKSFRFTRRSLLLLPLFALVLGGCSLFSGSKKATGVMEQQIQGFDTNAVAHLHVGDTVVIALQGPPEEIPPIEKPIKDDGTITLTDIGRVQAAGKTPGELEDAIHDLYVPKYYTHLNVTVKATNTRVYYVRGEVKNPNQVMYNGSITVSKAITAAGDFTDFANRSNVWLIRANGQRFLLNMDDILSGEAPDPPVYPGDQIVVGRRIF